MKSPARIIAEKISSSVLTEEENPIWSLSVNMFVGHEPDSPDICVTLYDTGGGEQNAKLADDMVTVQVRLRHPKYSTGYTLLQNIRLALEGLAPYSNDDNNVEGLWVMSPVALFGKTKANHSLFSLNLRILLTPANAGNRQTY